MDANEEEKMIRDKGWGECEREALWMFIIIYDMITRRLFWNNNSTTTSDVVVWVVFKKDRKPRESFVCGRRPHSFLFFFFFFLFFLFYSKKISRLTPPISTFRMIWETRSSARCATLFYPISNKINCQFTVNRRFR